MYTHTYTHTHIYTDVTWAAVHGVAQNWTRLKRLSSSRHNLILGKKITLAGVWRID